MEELLPNLFRIKIPLPDSPLKYLNAYVIRGTERHLIIDTGLNRKECLEAMNHGLKALDIDLACTDFFITHLHADHFGLIGKLATDESRIYFNRPEKELIETWQGFEPMIQYAGKNGFPEDELREALNQHPGHKFHSDWVPELNVLQDGDSISAGPYRFRCIETPGHTLGHLCLHEEDHKILVAGDHILIDITPNIQCWSDDQNPLKAYLNSLERVRQLDIVQVLPGHRRVFFDIERRIGELKNHHRDRIAEVMQILEGDMQNAFQVASKMTWDIDCESWQQFPVAQKWFATGEALAHLIFLEQDDRIRRREKSGIVYFQG
jgi:glyoxylase-like metal-dependent hydrolase (beta-lactamase superfamily II)